MKKHMIKLVSIAALAFAASSIASAAMINGALTIAGGATLNTDSVNTATGVVTWVDPTVFSRDGDFEGYVSAGDDVSMVAPWTFDSVAEVSSFWTVGGFSFDLTSSSVFLQSEGDLIVKGTGWISGNGFEATAGVWNFTSQNPSANGVFSFSASTAARPTTSVPDGGATVALIGSVLLGLGSIARRCMV
jgi:hypothetical protein